MSTTKLKRLRHSCCAFACEHFGYFNKCESFHILPKDPELRQKWVNVLKVSEDALSDPITSKNLRVCGNHFTDKDYKSSDHRRILDPSSIPSKLLEKDPETASFVPPVKPTAKKRRSYDAVLADNENDKSTVEDKEEEDGLELRSRPKRRAAKVAEKKMIEAASTMIDDMIKDEEEGEQEKKVERERPKPAAQKPKQIIVISPSNAKKLVQSQPSVQKPPPQRPEVINLTPKPKIESEMIIKTSGSSILNSLLPSSISIIPVQPKPTPNRSLMPKPVSSRTARKSFPSVHSAPVSKTSENQVSLLSKSNHFMELDMQCDEEPLSICQISAYNKSMMDYQSAVNKLKKLRSENRMIRYEYESPQPPQAININRGKMQTSITPIRQPVKA